MASLTDNIKSRDASASKKGIWKNLFNSGGAEDNRVSVRSVQRRVVEDPAESGFRHLDGDDLEDHDDNHHNKLPSSSSVYHKLVLTDIFSLGWCSCSKVFSCSIAEKCSRFQYLDYCTCLGIRMVSFRNHCMSHVVPTTQTINMAISVFIHISFSIIIIIFFIYHNHHHHPRIPIVYRNSPSPIDVDLPPTDPVEAPGCHRVVLDLLKLVLAWFCSCHLLINIMR